MGIYYITCIGCGKDFQWFSGNTHQICPHCVEELNKNKERD